METNSVVEYIVQWLKSYSERSHTAGFVVGVSGGIDSAVTSTLCAMTGKKVLLVEMPIYQPESQVTRAQQHIEDLKRRFPSVSDVRVDLTPTFDSLMKAFPDHPNDEGRFLALANTRARLRMTTLFYFAGLHKYLVAGTGNKIEDFGIGFFTKYGDGGVDLSPIADLTKTQVYTVAESLGIIEAIRVAKPTDGLWGDDRSDEDQIGASYPELEWAMEYASDAGYPERKSDAQILEEAKLSDRNRQVLAIYLRLNKANQHKMQPIPVCTIPANLK